MNIFAAALLAAPVTWSPPGASAPMPPLPSATSTPTSTPTPTPTPLAPPNPPPPPVDEPQLPLVNHRAEMWRAEIAYRGSFITDAGFGPFSTSQYLGQGSLAASRTLWRQDSWSLAPGLGFDFGGTSASARGQASSLTMDRLSVSIEGRRHFGPWGYAFLRVAPGLALEGTEIDEGSAPSGGLKRTSWMFSTDVSAGYAWLIAPRFDRFDQKGRIWLQADVGYGWVAGDELALTAPGANGGTVGVDLGSLSMSGPFMRFGGAVSF